MMNAKYSVYDSAIIHAPVDEVWAVVRDIMGLLPMVFGDGVMDHAWIDGGSAEKVPARFQFTLRSTGETVIEEVVARSEVDRSLTYRTHTHVLGVQDYIATYRVRPVTQEPGKTFIDWSRDFSVVPGRDPQEVVPALTAITAQEVATIKEHFARRRRGAAAAP